MIEDGLSYPMRGDWIGRIVIGGILTALSVFFLPMFLVTGYFMSVLRETVGGNEEPPEFTDWGTLFVEGIVATVITLVYSIVPVVAYVVFLTVVVGGAGLIGGGDGAAAVGFGAIIMTMFALIPLFAIIYYLVPAALTNYAKEGSIGAAFDFHTLKPIYLSGDYVLAILLPFVIFFAANVVITILSITIVGLLLVPFITFYTYVAVCRMLGTAFEKANRASASRSVSASPTV